MTNAHPQHQTVPFKGLSPSEVEASRKEHGANVLTPPERKPWWHLYLEKFDDPVIRILIIAATIAMLTGVVDGHYVEGLGIVVAILLATALAFANEYKAAKEFDILNEVNNEVPVKVIRNGDYQIVPKKDLVVGDVVLLELGDEVPCDGLLLETVSLQVDESCLTGESTPVEKTVGQDHEGPSGDSVYPVNRVFGGTFVRDGRCIMEVSAVGDASEMGHIAKPASEITDDPTPLKLQLARLSKLIGVVGFGMAGLTYVALVTRGVIAGNVVLSSGQWFFSGIVAVSVVILLARVWVPITYDAMDLIGKSFARPPWVQNDSLGQWIGTLAVGGAFFCLCLGLGYLFGLLPDSPADWMPRQAGMEFVTYFMIAVTIIVVAVPEGLAMSVTLNLAYNMRKMTAANNLVRHMHACETIGACTVICSDKTGTLTLNEMRVDAAHFPSLEGRSDPFASEPLKKAELLLVEAFSANSTAHLTRAEGAERTVLGNPTECALLLWLDELGIDYMHYRSAFSIKHQWPFSTERKFMGTLGLSSAHGELVLHVKGAPEIVMDRCATILTNEGSAPLADTRSELESALKDCQRRGMRTLGFAYIEASRGDEESKLDGLANNMTWLGFVAITDPVRPDVPSAVQRCLHAGIAVKVVTGDNPETALEIAREIGLLEARQDGSQHITGREFAALSDKDASRAATNLRVLSRARPLDKLRLVRLLREGGHVVAVTGDGTNDAPALNYADVGLSMGKSGTSIAKEASDIVLLDDSFTSIANAVMWGRSLYENIQRFLLFQLTINVTALAIALLGPFIGIQLPLTVTQMLWVNLIMDTFAAFALATEPPHRNVMDHPPRKQEDFIISHTMAKSIFVKASVFLVCLIWLLLEIKADGVVTKYELSVFFTAFVMLQFWNLFNARCLGQYQSALHGIFKNQGFLFVAIAIVVGQILIVEYGGSVFRTVPLRLGDWLTILLATSLTLWIDEVMRFVNRLGLTRRLAG